MCSESIGQRLKDLRNKRNISQNELSKYIGVSKSSVNMYERDEREPGFETLEAIADFFNVNMDYLMGREPQISTSVNSQGATITAQIDEKQFSASAQPTLIKFVAAVNSSQMPDFLDNLKKIRAEMDKTFTQSDFECLSKILEAINSAYEQAIASLSKSQANTPADGPQPKDTTPTADGPETAPGDK